MIETITINRNPSDATYKNRDEMSTVVTSINFVITLKDGYIFSNNTGKQTWSTVDKDFTSSSSSQTDIISSYSNSTTNSTLTIIVIMMWAF